MKSVFQSESCFCFAVLMSLCFFAPSCKHEESAKSSPTPTEDPTEESREESQKESRQESKKETATFSGFLDSCLHQDQDPEIKDTVTAIIRFLNFGPSRPELQVTDCEKGVEELKKFDHLTLKLPGQKITRLEPISDQTHIKRIDAWEQNIKDLSPLSELKNLTDLTLEGNQIEDISTLSLFNELKYLNLAENMVSDLTPLSELKKIEDLKLEYNKIADLMPLKDLPNLKTLDLKGNPIYSPSADQTKVDKTLANCPKDAASRVLRDACVTAK